MTRRYVRGTTAERFWAYVERGDGCWLWTAQRNAAGYGVLKIGGRGQCAHRVGYEVQCGPIPDGFYVCHHCDNPSCVRGDHLFVGTAKDNNHDRMAKGRTRNAYSARTHCKHGHEYTAENTRLAIRDGRQLRLCRACSRISSLAWWRSNRSCTNRGLTNV